LFKAFLLVFRKQLVGGLSAFCVKRLPWLLCNIFDHVFRLSSGKPYQSELGFHVDPAIHPERVRKLCATAPPGAERQPRFGRCSVRSENLRRSGRHGALGLVSMLLQKAPAVQLHTNAQPHNLAAAVKLHSIGPNLQYARLAHYERPRNH